MYRQNDIVRTTSKVGDLRQGAVLRVVGLDYANDDDAPLLCQPVSPLPPEMVKPDGNPYRFWLGEEHVEPIQPSMPPLVASMDVLTRDEENNLVSFTIVLDSEHLKDGADALIRKAIRLAEQRFSCDPDQIVVKFQPVQEASHEGQDPQQHQHQASRSEGD